MSSLTTTNYSLFTIPAYYLIAFYPHIYSAGLLAAPEDIANRDSTAKVKPGQNAYNMVNPRSVDNAARYANLLDKPTFQKWERARAAHDNMLESAAFVVSAFLAGIVTRLPAGYMNICGLLYLVSRVAYSAAYIRSSTFTMSLSRTVFFFAGNAVLVSIWWEAGKKIMSGTF